jgi:hypothetical protein
MIRGVRVASPSGEVAVKHFDTFSAAASFARSRPGACVRRSASGGFDVVGEFPSVVRPPAVVPCRYCPMPISDERLKAGIRVCSACEDVRGAVSSIEPHPSDGSRQPTCRNCSRAIEHNWIRDGVTLCRECARRQAEIESEPPSEECPRCGSVLVLRVGSKGHSSMPFLGCSSYPRCRYTAP